MHLPAKLASLRHTKTNWPVAALLCVALSAVSLSVLSQTNSARRLSVDMPSGGCSLTAEADGSAALHFGAMPRWIRVAPRTFKFDELAESLRARSYPQSDHKGITNLGGTLLLPGGDALLFIADHEFVRSLFRRAWSARVRPATAREVEDYAWVSKACGLG
jgi:hypothetical protein